MRAVRLFLVTLRISLQNEMAYRTDWFARLAQSLVGIGTTLGAFGIVFSHTDSLAGWTLDESVALLGVFYIVTGLIHTICAPNMSLIMRDVRDGTLDFLLLKPVNSQYYASIRRIVLFRMTDVALGLIVVSVALRRLAGGIGAVDAILFLVVLTCGMIVLYSIWLALVTTTFWFVKIVNIEEILWQALEAGRYPIDIYPRWLQYGLSYLIPIGLVITVPSRGLLGQLDLRGVLAAVALAAGTFAAASAFWRLGLRRYSGASA
ncbi:MAG: ABC-2 family transporter protein [Phycisphaerae bacterium]|nr:ABC-2 family transporter protein [Phycisphaerae bacterium]